ncbi:MAG: vitamin K epoxide reductase family protein [Actinomycetota bacterium]|nr:vitamin K epoxide reductase family protein [Actinomycetota bacterium]
MADTTLADIDDGYGDYPAPRWPWIAGTVLSVLGLGVSAYLTYEHYTGSTTLACPASPHSIINCAKVTTSPWSMWYGIPVAVLGLVYFVIMLALQSRWAWRRRLMAFRAARIAWCVIGLASAVRLIYYELYRIHAICEWCTSVHVITFLVFVATIFGTVSTTPYYGPE